MTAGDIGELARVITRAPGAEPESSRDRSARPGGRQRLQPLRGVAGEGQRHRLPSRWGQFRLRAKAPDVGAIGVGVDQAVLGG